MSFPLNPTSGQTFTTSLGTQYKYDSTKGAWIISSQGIAIPRITTYTGAQWTVTPRWDTTDQINLQRITTGVTGILFYSPTGAVGSPNDGQALMIDITGTTGMPLGWSGMYAPMGVALPTTTVASKYTYCGFKYNADRGVWLLLASGQET